MQVLQIPPDICKCLVSRMYHHCNNQLGKKVFCNERLGNLQDTLKNRRKQLIYQTGGDNAKESTFSSFISVAGVLHVSSSFSFQMLILISFLKLILINNETHHSEMDFNRVKYSIA